MVAMLARLIRRVRQVLPRRVVVIRPKETPAIDPADRKPLVIGPAKTIIVGPSNVIRVAPPLRAIWEEKGWSLEGNRRRIYRGFFQVTERRNRRQRRFPGRIEVEWDEPVLYICQPPTAIRSHPKGPCFNLVDNGWYRLHWHNPPENVDDAICYVESILDEVVNNRRTS